ncbi:cold shock domain-containing protein [Paucibacter sp. R3-3]|uniref:Cold shock domain-containing protein n=1 Tax=Roseateles agri TaxID=3098619 RepID=A0ABU5DA60_9BURK|nr:cold shock domain-containing protein [Paucibacter sp. R3-3]MDY0743155.1 cold shock domain-containing protein [Paucibacter sp. R3-3]
MRFEGTLSLWNPERGYGAIAPEQGGQELFVHVSAFPRDGAPPQPGEALSFEIVTSGDGRKQAGRVLRIERAVAATPASFMAPAPPRRSRLLAQQERKRRLALGGLALAVFVSVLGWVHVAHSSAERPDAAEMQRVR